MKKILNGSIGAAAHYWGLYVRTPVRTHFRTYGNLNENGSRKGVAHKQQYTAIGI